MQGWITIRLRPRSTVARNSALPKPFLGQKAALGWNPRLAHGMAVSTSPVSDRRTTLSPASVRSQTCAFNATFQIYTSCDAVERWNRGLIHFHQLRWRTPENNGHCSPTPVTVPEQLRMGHAHVWATQHPRQRILPRLARLRLIALATTPRESRRRPLLQLY